MLAPDYAISELGATVLRARIYPQVNSACFKFHTAVKIYMLTFSINVNEIASPAIKPPPALAIKCQSNKIPEHRLFT